jgi:anti-sigma regulatory factor (Ser/Thr protein kinase)
MMTPTHRAVVPADAATRDRSSKRRATRSVVDLSADVRTLTQDGEDVLAQRDQALRVLAATLAAHRAGWSAPDLYAVALLTRAGLMPEPDADPHDVLTSVAAPTFADLARLFPRDVYEGDRLVRAVLLPANPHAPGRARRLAVGAVADWCLLGLDEDAATVISELVTNVVRHTESETVLVTVSIAADLTELVIEVSDDEPAAPRTVPLPDGAAVASPQTRAGEGGAGMVIVNALAHRVDVAPNGFGGKVVTAALLISGAR